MNLPLESLTKVRKACYGLVDASLVVSFRVHFLPRAWAKKNLVRSMLLDIPTIWGS